VSDDYWLTHRQRKVLKGLEVMDARIIGWDTSVHGPLIALPDGSRFAVSPRGKQIDRPQKEGASCP
jgi:hypothetical protein